MSREQINKPAPQEQEKPAEVVEAKDLKNPELSAKTEDVLNELDEILEDTLKGTDALTWVSGYIQRGGQAIFLSLSSGTILKMLDVL